MPGPPLLFGKETRVLDRNGYLPGRCLHDFQVALLENVLAVHAHGRHHAGRLTSEQDRRRAEAFCRPWRHQCYPQTLAGFFQVRADQQRLPCADNVLGQAVCDFPRTLR